MEGFSVNLVEVERFILVLFRVSGILFVAPIFGARNLPVLTKTGLAILISFVLAPTVEHGGLQMRALPELGVALAREAMVGIMVGMAVDFFFSGVEMAGEWVGVQVGFGVANVLDPEGEHQVTILAQVKILIAFMLFLMVDGHHMVIRTVGKSFEIVPLATAHLSGGLVQYMFSLAGQLFVLGLKIASPIMGIILMVELAMALVARTVPQMNILMVGLPVKVLLGLVALQTLLPAISFMILKHLPDVEHNIGNVLHLLGK